MTKEFIEKRLVGKQKEIERLQKKLIRIETAKSSNWKKIPTFITREI